MFTIGDHIDVRCVAVRPNSRLGFFPMSNEERDGYDDLQIRVAAIGEANREKY